MTKLKNNLQSGSVVGYILFNFSKVAIATCGAITLVTTYSRPEPYDIGVIIIYTIIGVYTIIHALTNAGNLSKYKKTL
jgi:hypothetical protein